MQRVKNLDEKNDQLNSQIEEIQQQMGVPKPQYDQLKQKNNNLNLQINDHLDMIRERDAKLKAQQKRIEEQEKEILAMKTAVE